MHADKIVAMQDGRIVEVGSHTDLLANRGLYYHLYKAQFEHALSMPMPDEWGQEAVTEEIGADGNRKPLALASA